MTQSINLIPEQEIQSQTKTKVVKFSTIFSILLLIIVAGISAYYFYNTTQLQREINTVNKDIDNLRADITELAPIEISARNLYKKYMVLTDIFKTRANYSLLMAELNVRKPESVTFDTLTSQPDDKFTITGEADNYIAVANFTNNLLDETYEGGNEGLKDLFTSVTINSVSLKKSQNNVDFALVIEFKSERLTKNE